MESTCDGPAAGLDCMVCRNPLRARAVRSPRLL